MSNYHYVLFSLKPPIQPNSELKIRQTIQDALNESFGVALGSIYVDVLSVNDNGTEAVIRADVSDVKSIMASVAAYSSQSFSMRVVKDTSFLPALLSNQIDL
ncbi:hypothetical protein PM082_019890 [Marasmius tenuissimus]|nr:hypothetical protein PM082_019890 [Marasmius tenuissimus]